MNKLACVGILVADIITETISDYPKKGGLERVNSISVHTGGNAMTASINTHKLGIDSVILGMVGNDMLGAYLEKTLKVNGINTKGLKISDEVQTSASIVLLDKDGERSFFHTVGANAVFCESDIDYSVIDECDYVFVTGSFLLDSFDGEDTMNFLKKCKEMGKTTFLDVCHDATGRWGELLDMSMPYIDYLMPSIDEARCIAKKDTPDDIADVFVSKGASNIIIKLGSKGSYLRQKGEANGRIFDPFKVDKPVDSTGAGDSFCSGFISAYIKGYSPDKCMIIANAAGAMNVMCKGATEGVKSFDDTIKFIESKGEKIC